MKVCSHCRRCHDDSVSSCTEGHPPLSEHRTGSCELIPGYRLEQQLESGLKGETYLAREKVSGRTCLIRLLPPNEANREQFLYEARLAATLFHPNVADVYEADALTTGELYVVAEVPEGQTARELLKTTGTPPLLNAIQIVRQAAEAVHVLHLKGLIHRAISPENIVVTNDLEGQLLVRVQNPDFGGIAERAIVSNKFLIDTALGSIRYFAPEQCSGEPENIKTDIYALGVVLYEMIAGVPPFDAPKAAALIQMHRTLPPPEIRIDNFDLRMLLTHTLMESLQKQPRTRQSSANAFARQLRHMEQLATHVSTPPPAGVVPTPPPRPVSVSTAAAAAPATSAPTVNPDYAAFLQTVVTMDETAPLQDKPEPLPPAFVGIDPIDLLPATAAEETETPPENSETESMPGVDFKSDPIPVTRLQGPLDDLPESPESLTDIVPVEEADYEPAPATLVEAAPSEAEIVEPEPAWINVPPLPVVEPPAEEVVQPERTMPEPAQIEAEMAVPEPVQIEAELPELPVAPSEPQIAEPVFVRATPAKVVWEGLDDDIPSEEDVQAALVEEQLPPLAPEPVMAEPMPIETKPPAIEILRPILPPVASMPIRPEPAKIVCEDLDDIPSVEETQAASLEEELPRPITVPQLEHEAPRAQLVDEKPRPAVEPEVMATPEPVKKAERRKPVYQPAEDAIFASYSTTSRRPVNISYRSVLVSVGILAMAILILVGRVVMSGSFDDQGPLKTVQAETKTEQQPQLTAHPAPQNVVVPSKEPDPKNYDSSPFADEELDARQLKPLPSDDAARPQRQMFFPTPAAKLVSRDVSVATSEVTPRTQPPPPPAPVAKNNAKPLPFSPSVVIPYKGPQKSKTSNEKDCADQVSAPSQNKTSQTRAANITRPRIVRDPQN